MVPEAGVEPVREKISRDFKSRASANSAIPAYATVCSYTLLNYYSTMHRECQVFFIKMSKNFFQKHWQLILNVILYYCSDNDSIFAYKENMPICFVRYLKICRNIEAVTTRRSWKPLGPKPRGFESLFLRQIKGQPSPQSSVVFLFLWLRYERILTPLCDSSSRRMGFAFERKPSGSSLTSGGAKNLRQRRIPLFQDCSKNWNLLNTFYRIQFNTTPKL